VHNMCVAISEEARVFLVFIGLELGFWALGIGIG